MSKRYHIVECERGFPVWKLGIAAGVCYGAWWTYHHVLLPALHILALVLIYGALSVGALCIVLTLALITVCLIERHRHGRSSRGRRVAYMPGYRLARKDAHPSVYGQDGASHQAIPAGSVTDPFAMIDNEDKTFMFLHGIRPDDIFK